MDHDHYAALFHYLCGSGEEIRDAAYVAGVPHEHTNVVIRAIAKKLAAELTRLDKKWLGITDDQDQ